MAKKTALDKDLKMIARLQDALRGAARQRALGLGFLFLALVLPFVWLAAGPASPLPVVLGVAVLAGYVALSVAANDVALQVGPSVSALALPLPAALLLAALCEAAGALTAGHGVTQTVAFSLADHAAMTQAGVIGRAAAAALLAAALWINLATIVRANVSTTQAVVGGMLGVALAAVGSQGIDWATTALVVGGWIAAPLLAAVLAALLASAVKRGILHQPAPTLGAVLAGAGSVGTMIGGLAAYLLLRVAGLAPLPGLGLSVLLALAAGLIARRVLLRQALRAEAGHDGLAPRKPRKVAALLFRLPVLVAGALLAFGHGANDVANAVGPLAAVTVGLGLGSTVPWWVMLVGAAGLALGLLLFGPRALADGESGFHSVDPVRAFAVTAAAAGLVLSASALGLPVSATHTLIGAVFGVAFLREYRKRGRLAPAAAQVVGLGTPEANPVAEPVAAEPMHPADIAYQVEKLRRRRHRRQQYVAGTIAAWLITVPLVAVLAAGMYAILGLFLT